MLTVTDIFAGAGGSSTGMIAVPGVRIATAANHLQLAVDVHNANHPDTDHMCVDLHLEDPRNFPRTDILWASPECTKWSIANTKARALSAEMGGDPTLFDDVPDDLETTDHDEATRSRLLMFDVLRFIEHHRYRVVFVENVVDIATQAKYRTAWTSWQRGLRKLGYAYRVVSLNSMHAQAGGAPAPQSRDRLYVVAWPAGEKAPDIDAVIRPRAWCPRCDTVVESAQAWKNGRTVGRYRAQYVYACRSCGDTVEPGWLPAAAAIDWTLPGKLIGDRTKPLADKTRARIAAGIARYWRPFTLEAAGNTFERRPGVRTWPADQPLTTLHTTMSKALAVPLEGRDGKHAQPLSAPARTQTCRHETALAYPPFIAELRGGSSDARPVEHPLCTVTASGNHHGLVTPYFGASHTAQPVSRPLGTLMTHDKYALIQRHNSSKGDGAEMLTPDWEPIRTLTTTGHQSLITTGDVAAAEAMVDDCLFRMLEPHEVAAGMAFPSTYLWAGKRRDRVRLMGNAVTPPSARDLMLAAVESLGGAA